MVNRFKEASLVLPVHKENKNVSSIFYHGFKISHDKENDNVSIYKLYNNHIKVDEDSEMYKWFEKFEFKYVCDMLYVRRNFGKLFSLDRRLIKGVNVVEYNFLKEEVIDRIKSGLQLVSK
jgi:hypothetical protein